MSGMEKAMDGATPPLTRAERERLRALCEAATPGPWHFGRSPDNADAVDYFARGYAAGPPTPVFLVCVPIGDKPMNDEARFTAITGNGPTSEANALFVSSARNALPSLLDALDAAEARAERAEAFPSRCAFCEARTEATPRAAAEHIATCEKHPLRAAVEDNVALRALLNGAHQFVTMGTLTHPNPTVQAEASLWLDRCAVAMGWDAPTTKEGAS